MFFVRSIVFNIQTAPPVLLLPSGGQITGATVSVLKEYLSAQGTQPEARALRPQLVTLAQECRAAQLILFQSRPLAPLRLVVWSILESNEAY